MRRLRPHILALLFYAALAIAIDWPFLFSHKCLYLADFTYNLEPAGRLMRDLWSRSGHIPFWNPFVLCGAPQTQVLWPVLYLPGYAFVFFPFSLATGLFYLLHQLAAGMGGFLWQYTKHEDHHDHLKWLPPLIFGLVFMLSGYMAGSTINPGLYAAASWIPLALFLIDRVLARPRFWCVGLLGFTIGLQVTSGRPEILAGSLLLYFLYMFSEQSIRLRDDESISLRSRLLPAATLVAAVCLGFSLSAIDLLPMLELASHSPPVGSLVTLGMTYWSAGWFDFLSLAMSQAIGPLSMAYTHLYPTYPGDSPYITSMFVSAPVLTLAAIGFSHKQWNRRWLWAIWSLVAVVLSAGQFGFVLPLLQKFLPNSIVFRFPIKLTVFLILGLCRAACEGMRVFLDGGTRGRTLQAVGVAWFLVAAAGPILLLVPDAHAITFLPWSGEELSEVVGGQYTRLQRLAFEFFTCGLSGVVSCLFFLPFLRRRISREKAAAIWIALIGGLLFLSDTKHFWNTVDQSFYKPVSGYAQLFTQKYHLDPAEFRVLCLMEDPLPAPPVVRNTPAPGMDRSFMQYARMSLRPNTNIDSGIRLSNGVSTIPSWVNYFLYTGILPRSNIMPHAAHPAGKSDLPLYRWCQATGTRFVISPLNSFSADGSTDEQLPLLNGEYFNLVNADELLNIRVYSLDKVRPLLSLRSSVRQSGSRIDALTVMNRCDSTGYNPEQEVIVTDPQQSESSKGSTPNAGPDLGLVSAGRQHVDGIEAGQSGLVKLVSRMDDRMTVSVETPAESYLVVEECFYPGWEAYDNGGPTKIYIADGLFRAVHLNAGHHEIHFVYRPWSLFWGAIVSKVSLILVGFLILSVFVEGSRNQAKKS